MIILGISAFYHDSAAAIITDGKIIAAAQEERFTRKKHDPSFPGNAIQFCLKYAGVRIEELDAVAFYDKPFLKFERLLETYYAFAPKGLSSFIKAMPVWIKEKLLLKRVILEELEKLESFDKKKVKLLFPEHHLSHAASAFYPAPFEKAAILTIDGVGEWATASISVGEKNKIKVLKELQFPHSLGLLYSAFTYYLGFRVNSGEYKLMGLAPYGDPTSPEVERYVNLIKKDLVDIKQDGSIWLNQDYFNYAVGLRMVNDKKWEVLFGLARREPESPLETKHCNLGLAIQKVTEEVVILMAREAKKLTGAEYLCMAGGVALNCVANGKLVKENIFKDIFIQPAAGDAGGALGAALAAYHLFFEKERTTPALPDAMQGSYLGPRFSALDVELAVIKHKAVYHHFEDFEQLCEKVAGHISEGNAIGWMQGRMEFGPRALGARSILGDPRNAEMQKKLNLKIKYRESFRPFAPSVMEEHVHEYFELEGGSPYMLMVQDIQKDIQKPLPVNYHSLPLTEKLYYQRSSLPSITHIDMSARIQTVSKFTNKAYWTLLSKFKEKTDCAILINTSFNVRGEPIICTPEDAYRCFMQTEMDYLVIGSFLFAKRDQPEWKKKTQIAAFMD
ncbi:MAG: carbamoyltransferase [Saprospiraceae bacterium]|jgi:carbamoyltransferase